MRLRSPIVGLLLATTLLVACGDDDAADTSDSSTSTTADSTTSTSASTTSSTAAPTSSTASSALPTNPEDYATALVEAWSHGDAGAAEKLTTDDAFDDIFAYEGGGTWTLVGCDGAAGSSYCSFSAGGDPTVVVRVNNELSSMGAEDAVTEVTLED